jgi:hypothetical protein
MDKWLDLIKEQQTVVAGCVSDINGASSVHKANSHRKQYIKEIDILIQIIEAFHKISNEYLMSLKERCQSHLTS